MSLKTQYSRLKHHTLTNEITSPPVSPEIVFTVPLQEDLTNGTWLPTDLALSEIGVLEGTKQAFIRIDDEILEISLFGGGGGYVSEITTITVASYEVEDEDIVVLVDATSNNITVDLPDPTEVGRTITIKRIDATPNTVTLDGLGANIDNNSTMNIIFPLAIKLISDGSNWWII